VEEPTAPRAKTAITTANRWSGHLMAPRNSVPRAPSPPCALLPHGLFATRRMLLFGMDNATTSLTRVICPGDSMCVERALALPRNTQTQQETQHVAECPGFP
jgi:hypothetical protein